jgi:hypothetical protein
MTNSGDIYDAKPEEGSIERFFYDHGANTIEEKIGKLEKQLQEFPNHQIPKEQRLKELLFKWHHLRAEMVRNVVDKKEEQKKWQEKYKEVNDDKNSIDNTISPVDMAMLNGSIQIERDYD